VEETAVFYLDASPFSVPLPFVFASLLPPRGVTVRARLPFLVLRPHIPSSFLMALPQLPLTILEPYAWERSTVTRLALGELVAAGQLAANEDGRPAEWIVPPAADRAPNPPEGYVVSFIRYHERGFNAPASTFMRAMCHHYGVELHNFAPNAISQAATFVGVCEGYLGIPVNWELWVHFSARSSSRSPRRSRGPAARCAPAGCRLPCGGNSRTSTSPAP
jgi:hypothetical protein